MCESIFIYSIQRCWWAAERVKDGSKLRTRLGSGNGGVWEEEEEEEEEVSGVIHFY